MPMPSGMTYNYDDHTLFFQTDMYGKKLIDLGEKDDRIVVLTADLLKSSKVLDFATAFPDRTFNVGIAEQNLMGIAAGMALEGKIPFVSTFAAFASMRACEQLRTDICYNRLGVRIVATHSGLSTGCHGPTHHSTEDLAIVRSFPNLTVVAPADFTETAKAVEAAAYHPGPVYLRIGRSAEPLVYFDEDYAFQLGRAIVLRDGADVTIIACGRTVAAALDAAEILASNGISARILDMHTIKPIDEHAIEQCAAATGAILTAEDHSIIGGLGSAVSEVLASWSIALPFLRAGVPDTFASLGDADDLYARFGLDAHGLAESAHSLVRRK